MSEKNILHKINTKNNKMSTVALQLISFFLKKNVENNKQKTKTIVMLSVIQLKNNHYCISSSNNVIFSVY